MHVQDLGVLVRHESTDRPPHAPTRSCDPFGGEDGVRRPDVVTEDHADTFADEPATHWRRLQGSARGPEIAAVRMSPALARRSATSRPRSAPALALAWLRYQLDGRRRLLHLHHVVVGDGVGIDPDHLARRWFGVDRQVGGCGSGRRQRHVVGSRGGDRAGGVGREPHRDVVGRGGDGRRQRRRVGAVVHLMAVEVAVAVGVGRQRVRPVQRLLLVVQEVPVRVDGEGNGAGLHLVGVAEMVTIGVAAGRERVGPGRQFVDVAGAVAVGVAVRIERVEAEPDLLSVGHPVAVRVRVERVGAGAIAAEEVGGVLARLHRVGQAVTVAVALGEQIVDALEPFLELRRDRAAAGRGRREVDARQVQALAVRRQRVAAGDQLVEVADPVVVGVVEERVGTGRHSCSS